MIHFQCPSCGKGIGVKDSGAGKKGKCPNCGAAVHVPDALTAASKGPPPLNHDERTALVPEEDKAGQQGVSEQSQRTLQLAAEQAAEKQSYAADSWGKYPLLSLLVTLYRIAAALALLIGLGAVCFGLSDKNGMALSLGVTCIGTAVTAILVAEVVSLFLDMERNQQRTNKLLTDVLACLVGRDQSSDAGA